MAKKIYEGGILICTAIVLLSCLLIGLTSSKNETIVQAELSTTEKSKVVFKSTEQLKAEVKAICIRDNPYLFNNIK